MRQRLINFTGTIRDMRRERLAGQRPAPVVPLPPPSPETQAWVAAVERKAKARRAKRKGSSNADH